MGIVPVNKLYGTAPATKVPTLVKLEPVTVAFKVVPDKVPASTLVVAPNDKATQSALANVTAFNL